MRPRNSGACAGAVCGRSSAEPIESTAPWCAHWHAASYAREGAWCPWVAPRGLGRHLAPRVVLENAQNACARAREPSLVLTVYEGMWVSSAQLSGAAHTQAMRYRACRLRTGAALGARLGVPSPSQSRRGRRSRRRRSAASARACRPCRAALVTHPAVSRPPRHWPGDCETTSEGLRQRHQVITTSGITDGGSGTK